MGRYLKDRFVQDSDLVEISLRTHSKVGDFREFEVHVSCS